MTEHKGFVIEHKRVEHSLIIMLLPIELKIRITKEIEMLFRHYLISISYL